MTYEEVVLPYAARATPKTNKMRIETHTSESAFKSLYNSSNQSQMESYIKFVQQGADLASQVSQTQAGAQHSQHTDGTQAAAIQQLYDQSRSADSVSVKAAVLVLMPSQLPGGGSSIRGQYAALSYWCMGRHLVGLRLAYADVC
jgi:hypothetical protein